MQPNMTIGCDIAKHIFQAFAVDAAGTTDIRRKLCRPDLFSFFEGLKPSLVSIEACASAHHWARAIGLPRISWTHS